MTPRRGLSFKSRILSALISLVGFALLSGAPLFGQATQPNTNPFPWYDPVTHQPPNPSVPNSSTFGPSSWSPTTGNSPMNTSTPSMGNAPSPYTFPTPQQTEWYVNNHPDLKNLDPIYKFNIIYGRSTQYFPNSFYNNGQLISNWYLPGTWSSPTMNWQGVQPNGFLPSASATTHYSSFGSSVYNPTTYTPTYNAPRYQPPPQNASTPDRGSARPSNLNPMQSQISASSLKVTSALTRDASSVAKITLDREHALAVSEAAGDKVGQMVNHIGLAQILVQRGDFANALVHVTAVEPMVKTAADPKLRVDLLRAKSAAHMQSGDFESALADNREAMPILRVLNDEAGQAETFLSSAWAFQSIGDIQKAIGCYEPAVFLFGKTDDKDGLVRSRIGMGSLYQSLGQYDKAVTQYQAALPIASPGEQARIFASDADLLQAVGGLGISGKQADVFALAHYKQAQSLLVPGSDTPLEVSILTGMGRALMAMRAFKEAEAHFAQARTIVEATQNTAAKAGVIASTGELQYWIAISSPRVDPSRFKQALENYREALPLMRAIGDRAGEIGVLTNSGLVYDAMGKPKEALSFYLQALDRMEELQSQARLEEFRTNIAAQSSGLYGRAIQLEVETHQIAVAFDLSERARARLLLDQLGNARVDNNRQASTEFLAREEQLRRENISVERQLGQELSRPGPDLNADRVRDLQSRLVAVRASYGSLLSQLKLSNSAYASFASVVPLNVEAAQECLDPDTTVVSYVTAPDQTLAFVLTKTGLKLKKLGIGEAELMHEIATFRDFASEAGVSPTLRVLYKTLIAPLHSEIKTNRLVIVPHGVLHELPFAALTSDGHRFLADDYAISYLPSVSALSYLRSKSRSTVGPALVLANTQDEGSPRLVSADDEAQTVANLLGAKALVGPEATVAVLKRYGGDYNLIHIIAHFEIDRQNPMSSRILLSRGQNGDDGQLDLAGVYGLSLPQTDLVVLSGCQSQNGKRTRGDDIIGLSRAFLYAGSPSVIASLWSVDDDATQQLMIAFYTHLKEGASKVEALRAAQLDVRQKYSSPFYWAGFVLTGHPGAVTSSKLTAVN